MDKTDRIKQKLEMLGECYDNLRPFMQDYLNRVESFVESKEKLLSEAVGALRKASYNVSDVSKELSCSRTTLYNHNQLLKRYIELSIKIHNEQSPLVECDNLKTTRRELQEQIDLLMDRDITAEIDKHENAQLQRIINEQKKEIERLQERIHELSAENHTLKKKSETGNITYFK